LSAELEEMRGDSSEQSGESESAHKIETKFSELTEKIVGLSQRVRELENQEPPPPSLEHSPASTSVALGAEREHKKIHTKKKVDVFLSKLHEIVNEHTGLRLSSTNHLIRALAPHSTPALQGKLARTSPTGRRKTISMTKELFEQISKLLNVKNPNKAKIARQTGVSVVQVRKIASGGYDKKFPMKT